MLKVIIGATIILIIILFMLFCMLYVAEKQDEIDDCINIDRLYKKVNKDKKKKKRRKK